MAFHRENNPPKKQNEKGNTYEARYKEKTLELKDRMCQPSLFPNNHCICQPDLFMTDHWLVGVGTKSFLVFFLACIRKQSILLMRDYENWV